MTTKPAQILLIDDEPEKINTLKKNLKKELEGDQIEVNLWIPELNSEPEMYFADINKDNTELVITDYDLTKNGLRGFQGSNVRSWCHEKLIPVADFTRGTHTSLPDEPDLFGMRVPVKSEKEAIKYIVGIYRGFSEIREKARSLLEDNSSISAITARVLGRPELEPNLSLYFSRLATSNPWPRKQLLSFAESFEENHKGELVDLLSYVIGHVLQNVVIAFPGPLMNMSVLAAYLSILRNDAVKFTELTELTAYTGPFSDIGPYYWRNDVDAKIDELIDKTDKTLPNEERLLNRFAVEEALGVKAKTHNCDRIHCKGELGGFWCPFTRRPVCSRDDCSEASTAWIPDGADLCRVEKNFFDEFAPLLGL